MKTVSKKLCICNFVFEKIRPIKNTIQYNTVNHPNVTKSIFNPHRNSPLQNFILTMPRSEITTGSVEIDNMSCRSEARFRVVHSRHNGLKCYQQQQTAPSAVWDTNEEDFEVGLGELGSRTARVFTYSNVELLSQFTASCSLHKTSPFLFRFRFNISGMVINECYHNPLPYGQ